MGLATAQAFAEAGASMTLADVKEEAVREAADKLVKEGHRALAIPCYVSNDAQVQAMVYQIGSCLREGNRAAPRWTLELRIEFAQGDEP
jgi:NAD(P)-dependent dehydrogenase (short-subunit alcohol dehydrogenase family)